MKKYIIISFFCFICINLYPQGVSFSYLSFEEALTKAKNENKFLFIDCYTSWCGPCKRMEKNIFSQKVVGDFFNQRFINVKYDMEKPESYDVSSKYLIGLFPTFMIFSPSGDVISILKGTSPSPEEWLRRINDALTEGEKLSFLRTNYNVNKNPENTARYMEALEAIQFKEGISDLLLTQYTCSENKFSFLNENMNRIINNMTDVTAELPVSILKNINQFNPESRDKFLTAYNKAVKLTFHRLLTGRLSYNIIYINKLNDVLKLCNYEEKDLVYHYPAILEMKFRQDYNHLLDYIINKMPILNKSELFELEGKLLKSSDAPETFKNDLKAYCATKRDSQGNKMSPEEQEIFKQRLIEGLMSKRKNT